MNKDFKHDCHDCSYLEDWCDPNNDLCNLKPNCTPKCCTPLECTTANIEQAHCVPIIADKIFDCVTIENLQYGESDEINGAPIAVIIENYDPTTMISGMPICIDKVSTHVDYVGLPVADLPFKIGTQSPINFTPVTGSSTLATDFKAVLNTSGSCCKFGLGTSTKISSNNPLVFSGVNGRVTVTGRIGRACFIGYYAANTTFDINRNFPGIYPLNLFSKICLPSDQKSVNLTLSFDPCFSVDCVTPTSDYTITVPNGVASFNVSAEYSFLVKTEITASTTEKLGVFVSNNDVKCHDNNMSNCSR